MATEAGNTEGETPQENGTAGETPQGQQGQQASTPETGGQASQQASTPQEPVKLPDDHPLVKSYTAQKDKLAKASTELTEARAQAAKATKLEEELNKRPTPEALATLQTRYDRLEGFLTAVGGPLSKALDSRSFTRDLFETDKDIESIVKDWQKANPTPTAEALGSGSAGGQGTGKRDPNELLRIAAGKG